MSNFIKGIGSLFGGKTSDTSQIDAQNKLAADQREQQNLQLDRQTQELQQQQQQQQAQLNQLTRAPKGRRLLMAATGEQGVNKSPAAQSTLG